MDNWDQEAIDLVQPGFIEFGEDGLGSLGFIVVTGELDCRDADRDGQPGVEFSWQGSDEGDDASGRGWAALNPDGTLAKRCFTAAGHPDYWDQLVDQVRTDHCRKAGFIREFEAVAAGVAPEPGPTFLEKARARWAPPD
jgi:hypothetical protein